MMQLALQQATEHVEPWLRKLVDKESAEEYAPVIVTSVWAFLVFFVAVRCSYWVFQHLGMLRLYLLGLAANTVPALYFLFYDPKPLDGAAMHLRDAPAERRCYGFMLALLVLVRLAAVGAPSSPSMRLQCAAAQIGYVIYLYVEQQAHANEKCVPQDSYPNPFFWPPDVFATATALGMRIADTLLCEGAIAPSVILLAAGNAVLFLWWSIEGLIQAASRTRSTSSKKSSWKSSGKAKNE